MTAARLLWTIFYQARNKLSHGAQTCIISRRETVTIRRFEEVKKEKKSKNNILLQVKVHTLSLACDQTLRKVRQRKTARIFQGLFPWKNFCLVKGTKNKKLWLGLTFSSYNCTLLFLRDVFVNPDWDCRWNHPLNYRCVFMKNLVVKCWMVHFQVANSLIHSPALRTYFNGFTLIGILWLKWSRRKSHAIIVTKVQQHKGLDSLALLDLAYFRTVLLTRWGKSWAFKIFYYFDSVECHQ